MTSKMRQLYRGSFCTLCVTETGWQCQFDYVIDSYSFLKIVPVLPLLPMDLIFGAESHIFQNPRQKNVAFYQIEYNWLRSH